RSLKTVCCKGFSVGGAFERKLPVENLTYLGMNSIANPCLDLRSVKNLSIASSPDPLLVNGPEELESLENLVVRPGRSVSLFEGLFQRGGNNLRFWDCHLKRSDVDLLSGYAHLWDSVDLTDARVLMPPDEVNDLISNAILKKPS
ncbi:MAG: hypothetical protein AAGM67_05770, partial [Bacteroidota bacterium]